MLLLFYEDVAVIKPNLYNPWEKSGKILRIVLQIRDFACQKQNIRVIYGAFFKIIHPAPAPDENTCQAIR